MVDPATLPDVLPASYKKEKEGERKIELSEIIGLPDFDVCPLIPTSPLHFSSFNYPNPRTHFTRIRVSGVSKGDG
jgi:hypothetical protein